jgi:MFS family permease
MVNGEQSEQSVAELMQQISQQTATLVRQEIRLAQVELQQKGKRAGIGAGLFGGSGVVALYALGALIAGLIVLLATAVAAWLAALIVAAALALVAGVLALIGRKQIQKATPPTPERAMESVRDDLDEVKARASR